MVIFKRTVSGEIVRTGSTYVMIEEGNSLNIIYVADVNNFNKGEKYELHLALVGYQLSWKQFGFKVEKNRDELLKLLKDKRLIPARLVLRMAKRIVKSN